MFIRSTRPRSAPPRPLAIHGWLVGAALILSGAPLVAFAQAPPERPVDFAAEIQPILVQHCHQCHGASRQEGGLRLTSKSSALAGGDSSKPGIAPGDPAGSRLVRVLDGSDGELSMPPQGEGKALSHEQIALVTRWVREGAAWPAEAEGPTTAPAHWAWKPPARAPLPPVRRIEWPRHPLDFFALAAMEREGLSPAPEADRYTLARRLWLDLTGLPPSVEVVDRFAADTGADAYERLVERALADPAYGERWARMWLDLARYADSKGYGSDPLRSIWRYRDWVIEAFNGNQPYDRFTIEQLAGDLLPAPTADQWLATAFHRNTMANDEGGTDDEEFRVAAVKDRIETTMQVWMGLTMGCAKCHSHKFDPITQREYYQAYAFFDQTEDADRGDEEPTLALPTRWDTTRLAELRKSAARLADLAGTTSVVLVDQPSLGELVEDAHREQIKRLEGQIAQIEKEQATPILRELPADKRRVTHTMVKGNFRAPGDAVEPAVPAAFHPLPAGARADRLGLARWLMDANNPLTARVAVNRFWSQLFGAGLVATEEDFGTQGLPPTHPEMLDRLAIDFRESHWDLKQLLRTIVTSATYRQSSSPEGDASARDPRNRWLAHGPRFRLEAEMVRDQALSISGLLSRQQGGPSVYPPQPDGLWRAAFNGQRTWATSTGGDRHRRGLYTYWRRTVPYPSMAAFDAPSREICTLRRVSTNTPLQAFVTLNDPVYVEAAQALARRMIAGAGPDDSARCAFGLRLALARPPTREQIDQLLALYRDALDHFGKDGEAARRMATDPLGPLSESCDPASAAAWTVVANVLLNLDGVLSKR
jgi:mono/diheme cytochrome c family protein